MAKTTTPRRPATATRARQAAQPPKAAAKAGPTAKARSTKAQPKAQPAAARQAGRGAVTGRSETVGIRMTPKMETDFKREATRRGISLAELFDEMWGMYRGRAR